MNDDLRSLLPSTIVLGVAAAIALFLTLSREWAHERKPLIRGAVRMAVAATLFQAAHFAEEFVTGFHEQFPALLGLPPMPIRIFVVFNLAWLMIWSLSAWGLAARRRVALFPLWFLGIGSVVNGVAHSLLSVLAGGYFPGLVTSPVAGFLGILLLRRLALLTRGNRPRGDT